jgi:FkbM family methyltransferase
MPPPKLTREALRHHGFFDTPLAARLRADPAGLIDVGARWGISQEFAVAAPLFSALAFEPDPDEVPRVAAKGQSEDWAAFAVSGTALGRDTGTLDLNVYSRPNNSSIYPVSPAARARYNLGGFELTKTLQVGCLSLDSVIFNGAVGPRVGEVIKLDTQGSELEIIDGGLRTLRARTICLMTEVQFFRLYDGAPMFSDIDAPLRSLGFTFIGFSDFQNRSSKRLDKRVHWSRERVFQADAIYFRDPLVDGANAGKRGVDVAVFLAVLLGYFDLALEWSACAQSLGIEMGDLDLVIERISAVGAGELDTELKALSDAARRHPELGHVLAGKFVDERRDFATFHDISITE